MPDLIEIRTTPPDLFQRMERYPKQLDKEMEDTMNDAMILIQGSVPPYPPRNENSNRTGSLGRTIGSQVVGATSSKRWDTPEDKVRTVKRLGSGKYEARFGTRLFYAPKVIGSETQSPLFKALGWWTMRDVKNKAEPGIVKLFNAMADRLVKFLGG